MLRICRNRSVEPIVHIQEPPQILLAGNTVPALPVRVHPEWFQAQLANSKRLHGHALCLCTREKLKLQVRERASKLHLAVWPEQGHLHTPGCPFYSEQDAYTGRAVQVVPATTSAADNVRVARPPVAQAPGEPTGPAQPLWGLLHHLWESSGLNRWEEGWSRDWGRAQRALNRAKKTTELDGEPLQDRLFVPPPFRGDRLEEIEQEWQRFFGPLDEHRRGTAQVRSGYIVGVVKDLQKTEYGHTMRLQHLGPRISFNDRLAHRFARYCLRGWTEVTGLTGSERQRKVVALVQVEASRTGKLVAIDGVLMLTSPNLIPVNNAQEEQVAEALVRAGRSFTRPLSYEQSHKSLPSFLFRDVGAGPLELTEMHIFTGNKAPHLVTQALQRASATAHARGAKIWSWVKRDNDSMPPLPRPRTPEGASA